MDPRHMGRITEIAIRDPVAAYAIVMGIPEVPISLNASATFTSFDPTQIAIVSGLDQTIAQRVWIDNVCFSLQAPNIFAGQVLQTTWLANAKRCPGISVSVEVFSGPKYVISETFTPIENFCNWPLTNWVGGWPLLRQQNIGVSFMLSSAAYANLSEPNEPPLTVTLTFNGHAFLDTSLEMMSADEASCELNLMGIWTPDRLKCKRRPNPLCGYSFGIGAVPAAIR
jgi:hypothetical protein